VLGSDIPEAFILVGRSPEIVDNEAVGAIVGGFVWPKHGYAFEKSPKTTTDHLAVGFMSRRIDTSDYLLTSHIGSQRLACIQEAIEKN